MVVPDDLFQLKYIKRCKVGTGYVSRWKNTNYLNAMILMMDFSIGPTNYNTSIPFINIR